MLLNKTFLLCASAGLIFTTCKLSTPAAFLDNINGGVTLTNLKNVTSGYAGELYSGVITGTLTDGATNVKVAFDDGSYKSATVSGTNWKIFIPTGSEAAASRIAWIVGKKHTMKMRIYDSQGNTKGDALNISFVRQQNRDVNADGYADIIVGAYQNNGASAAGGQIAGAANKGAAYVYYGSGTGATNHPESATPYFCSGPPDCSVIQNPDNVAGKAGWAVAMGGDINGDGYADVVVGAWSNNGASAAGGQTAGPALKGAAYVFYGSSTGVTNHPESATAYFCAGGSDCSVIENPDNAAGRFGYSVAFAGDLNKDGFDDIVIGAYRNNGASAAGGQTAGTANKGSAYVFYGSANGVTNHPENTTPYLCSGPPDCSVIQNPDNSAGDFGFSVAFAGDVNSDGYSDIIIGASNNDGTLSSGGQTAGQGGKGAAYIYYGSSSGVINHFESATAYYCAGMPDCTGIQNPDDMLFGGFGFSVSYAGDVNGDGYSDVVIGASGNSGASAAGGQIAGATTKGAGYVFYGSSTGITLHPENAIPFFCAGPPDCSVIQNPDNVTAGQFGWSVSFAGDLNGDTYSDIVIGASGNNGSNSAGGQTAGNATKGTAYVFYGAGSGVKNHPENATPYFCSGQPDCSVFQNPDDMSNGQFGNSVMIAGDVNGDGYPDVIIGAPVNNGTSGTGGQTAGASNKGASYIFYGLSTGMANRPENNTAYFCAGAPSCSILANPDNAAGLFGNSVGYLFQPTHDKLWYEHPSKNSPHRLGYGIGESLAIFRREESEVG